MNSMIFTAKYHQQSIKHYQGNQFIEALPRFDNVDAFCDAFQDMPPFDDEERSHSDIDRARHIMNLSRLLIPLERHLDTAMTIDRFIREGYVGRGPLTTERIATFQSLYEMQKQSKGFGNLQPTKPPQISASLIGLSGMGKTTFVTRFLNAYPKAIFHQELNIIQIPYLHIEMPSDGKSIKGFAFAAIDQIIALTGIDYRSAYKINDRIGSDTLMRLVARVMNIHAVGILICDEVQNCLNSTKGGEVLMTELTSACNTLGVPILFIGTNKAKDILTKDFRQSRRSFGERIPHWGRLEHNVDFKTESPSEWAGFLIALWDYQWTRTPCALSGQLTDLMYHYSQGIIDVALKLFGLAQFMAINDKSEKLSPHHIESAFHKYMKPLEPMITALRENDWSVLHTFSDIAPIDFEGELEKQIRLSRTRPTSLVRVKKDDNMFVPLVANALAATGVDLATARCTAEDVQASGKAKNVADGVKLGVNQLTKQPTTSAPKDAQIFIVFDKVGDYRRAGQLAKENKTTVLSQLELAGQAPELGEVINLS